MLDEEIRPNLEVAIVMLGGNLKTAKRLNVSQRTLYRWRKGITPIPGEVAIEIEKQTKGYVKRCHLRPDFWPQDDA